MKRFEFIAAVLLASSACATEPSDPGEDQDAADAQLRNGGGNATADHLYTLTNDLTDNRVASFQRGADGRLRPGSTYSTGGRSDGEVAKLSQDSLIFDSRLNRFFAVNDADNTVAMLSVDSAGRLHRISTAPTSGSRPVSLTIHGDVVYVLNQGSFDVPDGAPQNVNLSGFRVIGDRLVPIPGSTQALSTDQGIAPTDIVFSPDGKFLVVTEVFTSKISTFKVVHGVAQPGNFQPSAGNLPFAATFSADGFLVASEIGNPDLALNASTVSSYRFSDTGVITPITTALPLFQNEACWIIMDGNRAYIANSDAASISGVNVSRHGVLSYMGHNAIPGYLASTGANAVDIALSPDHRYLYSLALASHDITVFSVNPDGGLTKRSVESGMAEGASGLVVR